MKTIVNCSAIVDTQLCSSRELKGNEAELPSSSWESLIWIPRVWFWWNTSPHTSISVLYLSCIVQHTISESSRSHHIITRHYNNHSATSSLLSLQSESQHIQMDSNHDHNNAKQYTSSRQEISPQCWLQRAEHKTRYIFTVKDGGAQETTHRLVPLAGPWPLTSDGLDPFSLQNLYSLSGYEMQPAVSLQHFIKGVLPNVFCAVDHINST